MKLGKLEIDEDVFLITIMILSMVLPVIILMLIHLVVALRG